MDIQPIKTPRDYRRTLKEIGGLMMAKRGTPEGDRLDVLVTLVEAWEATTLSTCLIRFRRSGITWSRRAWRPGTSSRSSAAAIGCMRC